MKHLNDNILASVTFKITGPSPRLNNICEVAIVPLNNGKPDRTILPLHILLQIDGVCVKRGISVEDYANGISQDSFANVFSIWYDKLNLKPHKRLIPIGFDLHVLYAFWQELFGWNEHGHCFVQDYFDFSQARDLRHILNYWNDVAWIKSLPYPFRKQRPVYLAQRLNVHSDSLLIPHKNILQDAMTNAKTYMNFIDVMALSQVPLNQMNYPKEIDYGAYNIVEHQEDE